MRLEPAAARVFRAQRAEPFGAEPLPHEIEQNALLDGEVLAGEFHQPGERGAGPDRLPLPLQFIQKAAHFLMLAVHGFQRAARGSRQLAKRAEQELIFLNGVRLKHGFQGRAAFLELAQGHGGEAALLMLHEGKDAAVLSQKEIDQISACLDVDGCHARERLPFCQNPV